jgi:RNA polymerase sigma factor (sigma-70 family)
VKWWRAPYHGCVAASVTEELSRRTVPPSEALVEAILGLELDSRAARVVELRFFGGLSEEEIARVIGVSRNTVQRDWKTARAWLLTRLVPAKRSRAKA